MSKPTEKIRKIASKLEESNDQNKEKNLEKKADYVDAITNLKQLKKFIQ